MAREYTPFSFLVLSYVPGYESVSKSLEHQLYQASCIADGTR